jgi:hypothetical protein
LWQWPSLLIKDPSAGRGDRIQETLALTFSWHIMPFLANIFRDFLLQKTLKLAPFKTNPKDGDPLDQPGSHLLFVQPKFELQ